MKLNKATYFSVFFLLCFLASFSFNTFQNISSTSTKVKLKHGKTISFNNKEEKTSGNPEFLFEENENETETDFTLQSFVLPFFISYFQYKLIVLKTVSSPPLGGKLTNPIFIEVCNFRI